MSVLSACLSEEASDPLGLESQTIESHYVGAGVLCKDPNPGLLQEQCVPLSQLRYCSNPTKYNFSGSNMN